MSEHYRHEGSLHSGHGNGTFGDIAHDIADLIHDIFELLEHKGCHPPCYCPGTMILTSSGEVAVEALNVGDQVLTASGQERPIRWIGRRQFDILHHAAPAAVKPVRIVAGAFGDNLPRRDLVVSPGHSIFVDDVLIPARFLINGTTIAQDDAARTVTYYHVELESHDVLVAEGLPAESYLDTGNRGEFENGGRPVEINPRYETPDWADTCAPLIKSGATVERVKQRLIERAALLGHVITPDAGLHVLADGAVIEAVRDGDVYRFDVPGGCRDVRLASRCWVPAHLDPKSLDDRQLGVCVAKVEIDGEHLALDCLESGWHGFGADGGGSYRWTDGSGELPAGARSIAVELCGIARYWAHDVRMRQVILRKAA